MKGVILAGGYGSRLFPITYGISKQLLPIYNKPMIYYTLAVLMQADIKDILIITTRTYINTYKRLLNDGNCFGINISFKIQKEPNGTAKAVSLAQSFINKESFVLIYGDNFIDSPNLSNLIKNSLKYNGATIFGYTVNNPQQYGIMEFDDRGQVISIEEKPENPKSNYCIIGLYCYNNNIFDYLRKIKVSNRGELEITDINKEYLKNNKLNTVILDNSTTWLDIGTPDSLVKATEYVRNQEKVYNKRIAFLEKIAIDKGWLNKDSFDSLYNNGNSEYYKYLRLFFDNT